MNSDKLLWLEVSNVRLTAGETEPASKVEIQIKADRNTPEPRWWRVRGDSLGKDENETTREILRAMDGKRLVLAGMGPAGEGLQAEMIRIQFADPGGR